MRVFRAVKSTYFSPGQNNYQLLYFSVSGVFFVCQLWESHCWKRDTSYKVFLSLSVDYPSNKLSVQRRIEYFWNCYIWMFTKGWRFCLNDYNFKEKLAEFCPLYNIWSFHPWHLPPHHCNSLFDFYFIFFPLLVLSSILMHGYSLYHLNCFVAGANFHLYFSSTEAIPISLAYMNLKAD